MTPDSEPPPLPEPGAPAPMTPLRSTLSRWPEAARAWDEGRRVRAYEILRKRRRGTIAEGERRAIDGILADRWAFAEQARAPSLGRLNGCGTGMYGRAEVDLSGGAGVEPSYVKTRAVSFLWAPLIPLDEWIVADAESGGWYFRAKVPMREWTRKARLAVLSVLGAIAVAVVCVALWAGSHADLHLLNGLPVEAEISIDGAAAVIVGPERCVTIEVDDGPRRIRCSVQGRVVEEQTVQVDGGADLVVYNVLGSAPLYVSTIEYVVDESASTDSGPAPAIYAGSTFTQRKSVDYVFRNPPSEVDMPSRKSRTTRTWANVDAGGWARALEFIELQHPDRPERRADLAERFALALPDESEIVAAATGLSSRHRTPEAHAKFLERLGEARRAATAPR